MDSNDRAIQDVLRHITRRKLLKTAGFGIGSLALGSLMAEDGFAATLAGAWAVGPNGPSGAQIASLRAQGQEHHLPLHGRRPVPVGLVRPEADARDPQREAVPGGVLKGRAICVYQGHAHAVGLAVQVQGVRSIRANDLRDAAAHPGDRRRHHRNPVDAHRRVQPRPGSDFHEYRLPATGPSSDGLLADLRSRKCEQGFARFRGAHFRVE